MSDLYSRVEEWTRDGRSVSIFVDMDGRVAVEWAVLRAMLTELGFTEAEREQRP